jgi:hypothetical protein
VLLFLKYLMREHFILGLEIQHIHRLVGAVQIAPGAATANDQQFRVKQDIGDNTFFLAGGAEIPKALNIHVMNSIGLVGSDIYEGNPSWPRTMVG